MFERVQNFETHRPMRNANINRYTVLGMLAATLLIAVHKVKSSDCMNGAGSIYSGITYQCAFCAQREDGQWFKVWLQSAQGGSCSGIVLSDTATWDLACGQYPTFNIYDVAENVSEYPYSGTCVSGSCVGTRGAVIGIDDFNLYGGASCR